MSTTGAVRQRHSYPVSVLARLIWAGLRRRKRSFARDAAALSSTLRPPPRVEGLAWVPREGGLAVVFDHYYSPTFPAWWSAITLTPLVLSQRQAGQATIRWIMTEAWTYPDPIRSHTLSPLSRWAFRRVAYVYDFFAMPPMPPRPLEAQERARVVRSVLAATRRPSAPVIALSPEGHDSPGAALMVPPSGVGRFLILLGAAGLAFLPAGIYEDEKGLVVRFGTPFTLWPPDYLPRGERDRWAADCAMVAIGRLLPPRLWGEYEGQIESGES